MRTIKAKYSQSYIERLYGRLAAAYNRGKARRFFVELDGKVITYTTKALEHYADFLQCIQPHSRELLIGVQTNYGWEHHVLALPASADPVVTLTQKEFDELRSELTSYKNIALGQAQEISRHELDKSVMAVKIEKLEELLRIQQRVIQLCNEIDALDHSKTFQS